MTGKKILLGFALVLLAAPQLAAQPPFVNIQIKPGNPRTFEVTPRSVSVCRNTPGCRTDVEYRWTSGGTGDEKVWVKYQKGLYWDGDTPTAVETEKCFHFPEGSNPFELERSPTSGKSVVFREDNDACPDKVVFFYEISCMVGEKPCEGIEPLDPATMVDNGRRSP